MRTTLQPDRRERTLVRPVRELADQAFSRNATDIPILQPLSRSGYRSLLEASVRVFEWNGTMIHAKTAVADGRWARVGSTNLDLQTWLGNCELDVAIEDERFAREMEEMYVRDLANATEVVLDARRKPRALGHPPHPARVAASGGSGNFGRAATGALRIGNTVGAAFTDRRTLEPLEARIMVTAGLLLLGLGALFAVFWVPGRLMLLANCRRSSRSP